MRLVQDGESGRLCFSYQHQARRRIGRATVIPEIRRVARDAANRRLEIIVRRRVVIRSTEKIEMMPVHDMTFLAVAGLLVENMRMAVVCQQVLSDTQSNACQMRNVQPKRGLSMGLNPEGPITCTTLSTIAPNPVWATA